jgi:error-prone DNA polymerase
MEDGEVRLGLRYVTGLRKTAGERLAAQRAQRPFASLQDFVDRAGLQRDERLQLAEVGALNAFGLTRRSALWQVEKAGRPRGPLQREAEEEAGLSPLPEMSLPERLQADLAGTGLTAGPHPVGLQREQLRARGVRRAADLPGLPDGSWVKVAGAVICRQRPGTAKGFLFLTLEDETGLVNVIVRPDLYEKRREVLVGEPMLEIDGVLQAESGLSVRASAVRSAGLPAFPVSSHDFR